MSVCSSGTSVKEAFPTLRVRRGDLFGCQTRLSIEIIFSLTLALSLMRFQFMSCGAGYMQSGFIINELS